MSPTPHTTPDGQPIGTVALTARIVAIAFFTFICYLAIGLPLAVLPAASRAVTVTLSGPSASP